VKKAPLYAMEIALELENRSSEGGGCLESDLFGLHASRHSGNLPRAQSARYWRAAGRLSAFASVVVSVVLFPVCPSSAGQSTSTMPGQAPPEAPYPQTSKEGTLKEVIAPSAWSCDLRNAGATMAATAAARAEQVSTDAAAMTASPAIVQTLLCVPHLPIINWYARFLNGPQVKALTPRQKAHLAARNLVDPFNLLTIFGEASIAVAANPHSPYGPGMPGYGRYSGVSFTEDMTGEFFGTFLIPSIVHQDPHYHRMPKATIPHRIFHAIDQVVWTQGDNGKGMVNYADLVGFAVDDAIGNLYVPGQQTALSASVERYGFDLATAPIDNFITEFLPDVARRIHVHVVLVQRIINQVATTPGQ
jgi:hypothetical protein